MESLRGVRWGTNGEPVSTSNAKQPTCMRADLTFEDESIKIFVVWVVTNRLARRFEDSHDGRRIGSTKRRGGEVYERERRSIRKEADEIVEKMNRLR